MLHLKRGGVEICVVPGFQGSGQRQQPSLSPPPPPPPPLFAPECLHERSHVRIITPSAPPSGEALRHVSALKGLSYTTSPSETGRPADRAITLSLCPLSSGSQWRPTLTSLAHARTHASSQQSSSWTQGLAFAEGSLRACVHPSIPPACLLRTQQPQPQLFIPLIVIMLYLEKNKRHIQLPHSSRIIV